MIPFYLVQRLVMNDPAGDASRGFDAYFQLEYMGSSEFEWGAVPAAIKRMRERPAVVEERGVRLEGDTRTVYFVGHEGVAEAGDRMQAWSSGGDRPPYWGKEWTHFPEVLTGERDDYIRTNAWWDIGADVAWALDRETADTLATAFNSRPKK